MQSIIFLPVLLWHIILLKQTFCSHSERYLTFPCPNNTECESLLDDDNGMNNLSVTDDINYVTTDILNDNEWKLVTTEMNDKNISVTTLPPVTTTKTPVINNQTAEFVNKSITANVNRQNNLVKKSDSEICPCDLQVSRCDINCCCDKKCTVFHLTAFSSCSVLEKKIYDSRYCYTKNFIQYNNTEFILERIADNLFCIAYDNLPPVYSQSSTIKLTNRKEFDDVISRALKSRYIWNETQIHIPFTLNANFPYQVGDIIWKIESEVIKPLELPSSGFTSHCSFRNNLEYLRDIDESCLQTKLNNNNTDLFIKIYNNFTVVSSPIMLNFSKHLSLSDHDCPKNVCIPIETRYCLKSWNICNITTPLNSSCANGTCNNIVKRVSYVITHNGTMGIQKIRVNIELGNVSTSFHQHFQVKYEWAGFYGEHIMQRSGNPGYLVGKPILIGKLSKFTSNNIVRDYISINATNYFLTVPVASKNRACDEHNRYTIGFAEDIKSKCFIHLQTSNFSVDTCSQLHKKIIYTFFEDTLANITTVEQFKLHVSKASNVSNCNITDWHQVFLNKLPKSVVGKKTNNVIQCLGLISSLNIDILYYQLPKPDDIEFYKIIGIGITVPEERNISFPDCITPNCTKTLEIELVTFVKFHDISSPTIYYAGGPNLDISLPYDFFYPFMSGSSIHIKCNFIYFIVIIFTSLFLHNFNLNV